MVFKKGNIKKDIEQKQGRLNRFVNQGRLTQAEANFQVRQFARVLMHKVG